MAEFLSSLQKTVIAGFVLALVFFLLYLLHGYDNATFWPFFFRWLHIISGVMWIGLLWYFNFVQTPGMPKIPDEQKPAITQGDRTLRPLLVPLGGDVDDRHGVDLGDPAQRALAGLHPGGRGPHLAFARDRHRHVARHHHVVQRVVHHLAEPEEVLGIVEASADEKKAAARMAGMASRINTMLSIPMLFGMAGAMHLT